MLILHCLLFIFFFWIRCLSSLIFAPVKSVKSLSSLILLAFTTLFIVHFFALDLYLRWYLQLLNRLNLYFHWYDEFSRDRSLSPLIWLAFLSAWSLTMLSLFLQIHLFEKIKIWSGKKFVHQQIFFKIFIFIYLTSFTHLLILTFASVGPLSSLIFTFTSIGSLSSLIITFTCVGYLFSLFFTFTSTGSLSSFRWSLHLLRLDLYLRCLT